MWRVSSRGGLGTGAVAVAILAACGSSTSNSSQPSTGGDAGATSDAPAATTTDGPAQGDGGMGAEAEPPDDGPWPATHFPLPLFQNLGGNVIAAPKLVTVTFAGNPDRDALRAFAPQFEGDTSWWQAVTQGYGIGTPTDGGSVELPDTVSNTTQDDNAQIQPMIQQLIAAGTLPEPDANTIYVIYYPPTTTITLQGTTSCQSASGEAFGAYHNSVNAGLDGGGIQVAYAIIADCPVAPATDQTMADFTSDVSHEVIEASTDPEPEVTPTWYGFNNAWFHVPGSNVGQGEVADVCQRYGLVTDASGNALVRSWVNAAAAASQDPCQPEPAGEIFYSLAVPTTTLPGLGDGYVVARKGTTQTLDAVFFSDAKLPNDAQIVVGARGHGGISTTIGTGITVTATPTAVHNGMHVAITVTIDQTATSNDYNVTARASESSTDHHDWPFIIHVP